MADEWLAQYRNTVKESTYVAQRLASRKHVLPLFWKDEDFKNHDSILPKASELLVLLLQEIFKSNGSNLFHFKICAQFTIDPW
ncbi:hypothetical protein [Enterococcus sp.]|uniref:hypothetical protein n=1 Tax=Enterococcus sp. TaxID=35783 RepID=UPI0028AEC658|nr:hypothetical protein [Enterococcus sp.]